MIPQTNHTNGGLLSRYYILWARNVVCTIWHVTVQSPARSDSIPIPAVLPITKLHGLVTVTIKRSYDQSKWRTLNTVSTDFRGLCQHGTSSVVHIAHGECHGTDWFFGCEKLERHGWILQISGWENFGELIVTVTPGNRPLIVTAGCAWS